MRSILGQYQKEHLFLRIKDREKKHDEELAE